MPWGLHGDVVEIGMGHGWWIGGKVGLAHAKWCQTPVACKIWGHEVPFWPHPTPCIDAPPWLVGMCGAPAQPRCKVDKTNLALPPHIGPKWACGIFRAPTPPFPFCTNHHPSATWWLGWHLRHKPNCERENRLSPEKTLKWA